MTLYVPSLSIDDVIVALDDFITPFIAPLPAVRAQVNRVPLPKSGGAVLTELLQVPLSIPETAWIPQDNLISITGPARIDVQIDIYGPNAGSQAKAIMGSMRTGWGYDAFPVTVKPLYTSDAIQAPLITGEQQYESRWTLTVSMQYNPELEVPQQFADEASVATTTAADIIQ